MIHTIIHLLEIYIIPLGGFGVFVAEVIEEVIVPIPSAVILLGSGFLFLKGSFSLSFVYTLLFTIMIPATLGLTLGSLVIYTLAYKGGKPFLDRFGTWIGVKWTDIESLQRKFEEGTFDEWTFMFARVFPVVPSVLIAVFCGLTRMPIKKYISLTLIGASLKALLLALVGWQVGGLYLKYANVIGRIENTVFALTILSVVGFLVYRKAKQKVV